MLRQTVSLTMLSLLSLCTGPLLAGDRIRWIEIDGIRATWDTKVDPPGYIEDVTKERCHIELENGRAIMVRTDKAFKLNPYGEAPQQVPADEPLPPGSIELVIGRDKATGVPSITLGGETIKPTYITQDGVEVSETEMAMYTQLNNFRKSYNLPPLKVTVNLMASARNWARNMASRNSMYHQGGIQENVAYGNNNAVATTNQWINSSAHNANMRTNNQEVGLSYARSATTGQYYWVQQFATGSDQWGQSQPAQPIRQVMQPVRQVIQQPVGFFRRLFRR